MTRDGIVDKNLATGEETRVSQRGQDFQLKQDSQQPAPHSLDPSERPSVRQQLHNHRQPAPEQSADFQQDRHSEPARHDITPDRPMEAARPTARSHEASSHEAPAGPKPQSKQAAYQHQNTTAAQTEAGAYQTPSGSVVTPHSSENRPFAHLNATENPPTFPQSPVTQRGRLNFAEGPTQAAPSGKLKQHGTKYQQQFAPDAAKPDTAAPGEIPVSESAKPSQQPHTAETGPPPAKQGRLQYAADELPPDKKLSKLQSKADHAAERLEKARDKLPSKRKPKAKRVYDEAKGKAKTKIQFEKEVIPQGANKPPISARAGKMAGGAVTRAGINKIHQKISEVEHDNVGVRAAHKIEQTAENAYRGGKSVRSAYRFVKERPYRRVAKLEKQATKANIKLSYRKALQDNPKLKSNVLSRIMQKRKIKLEYAKAARDAKKAAQTAKKTGSVLADITKTVVAAVKSHPAVFVTIGAIALLIVIIMSTVSSCSNMALGGLGGVFGTSYLAEAPELDGAEVAYTQWETDLQMQVKNAERTHPGFDEYRYNVDDVGHDPYELAAYLTAAYQDFTYAQVEAVLRQVFAEQYQLSFDEETEIRYRTETRTDSDGNDYTVEVPYEWHILNINLRSRSFTDVVAPRMDATERGIYDLLMESKGNRQFAYSPFDFNWLPYVSCYYGYRIHPITGAEDFHKAVDIAVAQGTEIIAAHDGTVTTATFHSSYGNYIALDDGKGLVTKYAHCSQLLVSVGQQVKKGDVIAKVGSTGDSTGPHLHFEMIYNGQYLNPLYFAVTNDDGSGRNPPGSPGGPVIPDYPGAPLGDGSFAAMIAEGEKHLGKKYVFGASGPANFDCSGFVSWVLDKSGVHPMGRTNAQGLYNICTPVSAANAQPGDLIFFTGTYSTPNACSHVGIYVGNGMMLHCGDPIQYTSINTRYWQDHFYAFGRIN